MAVPYVVDFQLSSSERGFSLTTPFKLVRATPLLLGSIQKNYTGSRPIRFPFEWTTHKAAHAARIKAVQGRFAFVNTNSHEFSIRRRAELDQEE